MFVGKLLSISIGPLFSLLMIYANLIAIFLWYRFQFFDFIFRVKLRVDLLLNFAFNLFSLFVQFLGLKLLLPWIIFECLKCWQWFVFLFFEVLIILDNLSFEFPLDCQTQVFRQRFATFGLVSEKIKVCLLPSFHFDVKCCKDVRQLDVILF